jgi:hypothetical protein
LTVGNFYETENDNEYCCETCPDEEKDKAKTTEPNNRISLIAQRVQLFEKDSVLKKSLSDEEKTKSLQRQKEHIDHEAPAHSKALNEFLTTQLNTDETMADREASESSSDSEIEGPDADDTMEIELVEEHGSDNRNDNENINVKLSDKLDDNQSITVTKDVADETNLNTELPELTIELENGESLNDIDNNFVDPIVPVHLDEIKNDVDVKVKVIDVVEDSIKEGEDKIVVMEKEVIEIEESKEEIKVEEEIKIEENNKEITMEDNNKEIVMEESQVVKEETELEKMEEISIEKEEEISIEKEEVNEKTEEVKSDEEKLVEKSEDKPEEKPTITEQITSPSKKEYPDNLNPFGSEDEDQDETEVPLRKEEKRPSMNPFGSCSEDESENHDVSNISRRSTLPKPPRPPPPKISPK